MSARAGAANEASASATANERRGLPREAILIYRGLLRAQRAPHADLEARVARLTAEFGGNGITGSGGTYGGAMPTLRDEANEASGTGETPAAGSGEAAPAAGE